MRETGAFRIRIGWLLLSIGVLSTSLLALTCTARNHGVSRGEPYHLLPPAVRETIERRVAFPGLENVGDFYSIPIGRNSHRDTVRKMVKEIGIKNTREWFRFTYNRNSWPSFAQVMLDFVEKNANMGLTSTLWLSYGMDGSYPRTPQEVRDFGEYCGYVAGKLAGKVKMYIIFGEVNHKGRLSPEEYMAVIRAAIPLMRKADNQALISSASLNSIDIGYMERLLKLGLGQYVDFVSFNPYNNPHPPELKQIKKREKYTGCWRPVLPGEPEGIHGFENEVRAFIELVHFYAPDAKIEVGEYGWGSKWITELSGDSIVEVRDQERAAYLQALYLARRMFMLLDLGVKSVCYFTSADRPRKDYTYGIMDTLWHPKPSYYAYETVCKIFYDPLELEKPNFRIAVQADTSHLQFHQFLRSGYELLLVLWSTEPQVVDILIEDGRYMYPVQIPLFDRCQLTSVPYSREKGATSIRSLEVGEEPIILRLIKEG